MLGPRIQIELIELIELIEFDPNQIQSAQPIQSEIGAPEFRLN